MEAAEGGKKKPVSHIKILMGSKQYHWIAPRPDKGVAVVKNPNRLFMVLLCV